MKIMKKVGLMFALVSLISIKCYCQEDDITSFSKTFKIEQGGSLELNVAFGSITIIPWNKSEINITASGMQKADEKALEIEVIGNRKVKVDCNPNWGGSEDMHFDIKVPRKFNLNLNTKAGDITISGKLEGDVNAKSYGGEITVGDITGNFMANTSGGDIATGNIDGSMNLNTLGGDIRVGAIKGSLIKINTNGGDVSIKKAYSGVSVRTMGGDIRTGDLGGDSELITLGGDISAGNVRGGINMETYGGDLTLAGANGRVSAKTSGGNITMHNISGSVTVKTPSGNIDVTLYPSPNSISEISTSNGSIDLHVPQNAKTTIRAKVRTYDDNNSNTGRKIYSEYPASESSKKSGSYTATYIINGGGSSSISLRSGDDSGIRIFKAIQK